MKICFLASNDKWIKLFFIVSTPNRNLIAYTRLGFAMSKKKYMWNAMRTRTKKKKKANIDLLLCCCL